MREQDRAPRKYELMTILHPEVADESLPAELDRIQAYIAEVGGELIESLRDSPWGRRRLAYPIRSGGRDVRDGYYTVWHFSIAPSRIDELERELRLNPQVIRYIVVSWEPKPIDPKEVEAAEIAAEDAAAAAYAAAQAAEAELEAAQADEAAAALAIEPVAAVEARQELEAEAAAALAKADEAAAATSGAAMGIVAPATEAEALTAEAEAVEASGAELAIEPVAAVEEREELEAEAAAALAKAEAAATAGVPAGAVRGEESGECPADYPIKGNASSMLYHVPESRFYKRTHPEYCFATVEAAEAAGFSAPGGRAAEDDEQATEAAMGLVASAEAAAEAAAATEIEVPAGAIRGVASGECPDDYPVKGNASSMLYHTPGSPAYSRTIPEFCFASVEAAEAAGFGPTKYEAAQEGE